jgi:ubiquinone/menaquinone biosynthesis C-methylase UbiE
VSDDSVIGAYSREAGRYDGEGNLHSCWAVVAERALAGIGLRERHRVVVEVGCGSGRALRELAARAGPGAQIIGIEPAEGMRVRACEALRDIRNVSVVDGRFEKLPIATATVDYLLSILAFHWTTDPEGSVDELARVLRSDGEMDLFFSGRETGREFTARTTPVFLRYMGPALLLQSAGLRTHLTREAAERLFRRRFAADRLAVDDSIETHYDDLEGHWSWWVARAAGHFGRIPAERRAECDAEVREAIRSLGPDGRIPYTVHLLHVRLRS